MKNVVFVLVLALVACKSSDTMKSDISKQKNELVYYSKSPCYGKCPVYDFRVFTDGTAVLTGVKNMQLIGSTEIVLTATELDELTQYLKDSLPEPMIFRKIRDLPVTTLRFDDMEYEYHSRKAKGPLRKVEAKMKSLVDRLQNGAGDAKSVK